MLTQRKVEVFSAGRTGQGPDANTLRAVGLGQA